MADTYIRGKDLYGVGPLLGPDAPSRFGIPITPSDSRDVTNAAGDNARSYAKALYIGVSGDLSVIHAGDQSNTLQGTAVLYKAVPVGWFPVQVRRVMATNTTATNIVGLYDQ